MTTSESPARAPRRWRRYGRLAPLASPLVLLVGLAACGDDGGAGAEAVQIQPTSYVMQPVTPPSSTGSEGETLTSVEEGRSASTQNYTIRSGDSLSGIASRFDVAMNEICSINRWSDCESHVLLPNSSITIPPGAAIPSEDDEEEEEDDSDPLTDTTDDEEAAFDEELCPDGTERGTYEIEAEDTTRTRVANKLDVTVEQLDATNANTPGYSGFYPGLEILVPCEGEGEEDEE